MRLTQRFLTLLAFIGFASLFLSSSSGRFGNYAGAPGDSTCSGCHSGSESGNILLTGVPTAYTAGTTYPLTLFLNQANLPIGGFQLVATDGVSNSAIGSFSTVSGETKIQDTGRLVQSTPKALSGGSVSWTTNWTAPSTGSAPTNVVFYYTGVAADGAGNGNGGTDTGYSGNSSTVLPVELISFYAEKDKNNIALTWETTNEVNHDYFSVERSIDGLTFETVGKISAPERSEVINDYQFIDSDIPTAKNVYYRLQQVDYDGDFAYSEIRSVSLDRSIIQAFPNPLTTGESLQIRFEATEYGQNTVELFNSTGQSVYQKRFEMLRGDNQVSLETSDLTPGIYFLRTSNSDRLQKIVVE